MRSPLRWLAGLALLAACSSDDTTRTPRDGSLLVYGDGFDDYPKRAASLVIERASDGSVVHTSQDTIQSVGGGFVFTKVGLPPGDYRVLVWVDGTADGVCTEGDVVWEVDKTIGDGAVLDVGLFPPKASDPALCAAFSADGP